MDLQTLRARGGVVGKEPVCVPVTWTAGDGEELLFDVWIKPLSAGDMERMGAVLSDGERSKAAVAISTCVLLGDGKEPMDYVTAYQLKPSLSAALLTAINSVAGVAPKN